MMWTGIEGNLPRWEGASAVYSRAYRIMEKYGADDLLMKALGTGDEAKIKTNLLRINEDICSGTLQNSSNRHPLKWRNRR